MPRRSLRRAMALCRVTDRAWLVSARFPRASKKLFGRRLLTFDAAARRTLQYEVDAARARACRSATQAGVPFVGERRRQARLASPEALDGDAMEQDWHACVEGAHARSWAEACIIRLSIV